VSDRGLRFLTGSQAGALPRPSAQATPARSGSSEGAS
jgi:hypothetical protein